MAANPALTRVSSGYLGTSDGWTDLRTDHQMDWSYVASQPGNVVQTGQTSLTGLPGRGTSPWPSASVAQPGPAAVPPTRPCDLYQIATGLLADGDEPAANRALDYLWQVQQRPDGSFPQNSRLDGAPVFTNLQMDEVAFPIVLAWQLGRTGASDWAHVQLSADYLVAHGPASPQERWENLGNYSPATIAAEIAGLACAAGIARENGDHLAARRYVATADAWRLSLDQWTRTTNGPPSHNPYYLRVSVTGDANAGTEIRVPDGGPLVDERRIVDPSFLELVRLGVSAPMTRTSGQRSRSSTARCASRRPTGHSGTARRSTGMARDARRLTVGAHRRRIGG